MEAVCRHAVIVLEALISTFAIFGTERTLESQGLGHSKMGFDASRVLWEAQTKPGESLISRVLAKIGLAKMAEVELRHRPAVRDESLPRRSGTAAGSV